MIGSRFVITSTAFVALGLMGMSFAFFGTSLPALRDFLNIDLARAGILTALLQAGFALTTFVGGALSDLIRRERVLAIGCLFLGLGAVVLGLSTDFLANLFVVLCMGIGAGFVLSSSNALLVGLYPDRKGTILNIHHVFFGVGSLIGPLIMGYLLLRPGGWLYGYDGLGIFLLVLFVFFASRKTSLVENASRLRLNQLGSLLIDRNFILLVLVNGLATGSAFALMLLAVTFMKEAKGFNVFAASAVFSLFYVSLVAGRLICSWLNTRLATSRIVLFLLLFLSIVVLVLWQGNGWVSALALIASGLAYSGIFPGLLALTGTLFANVAGTALGILATMGGAGGMVICWLTGLLFQRVSVEFGLIVLVVSLFLSLFLFLVNYRIFSEKERLHTPAMR